MKRRNFAIFYFFAKKIIFFRLLSRFFKDSSMFWWFKHLQTVNIWNRWLICLRVLIFLSRPGLKSRFLHHHIDPLQKFSYLQIPTSTNMTHSQYNLVSKSIYLNRLTVLFSRNPATLPLEDRLTIILFISTLSLLFVSSVRHCNRLLSMHFVSYHLMRHAVYYTLLCCLIYVDLRKIPSIHGV